MARNTVRLNSTVFLMEYEDKQEELHLPDTLSGTGQKTVVANASTAEMKEGNRIAGRLTDG